MPRTAPRIVSALLLTSTVLGSAAFGNVLRHSWKPVPQARYYKGTVSEGGQVRRFRTPDHWVLFPEGAALKVDAYDARGRKLGPVETQAAAAPAPGAPAPVEAVGDQEIDALVAEETSDDEVRKPAPAVAKVEDDGLRPPPPSEPSVKNLDFIALLLGAGRETISAHAGVSKFEGEAGIGGTILSGRQQQATSAWYFDGLLAAHNFKTKVKEAQGEGDVTVERPKFLRLFVRGGAFYDFFYKDANDLLAAGAGLIYARLPGLDIADPSTKEAKLDNVSALGPYFALQYQSILSAAHALSVLALYEPLVLNPDTNGSAYALQAGWRYMFAPPMFLELGLQLRHEAVDVRLDCNGVANCAEKSETKADTTQGLVGFGYKF